MKIRFGYYPGGKRKALTMSYDDGKIFDLRLIETFDKYGIRGSFHLNSANIGKDGWISAEDVAQRYKNHEVSCHSLTHPYLERIPQGELVREIMKDRENLEGMCGYPVRGMSYPYGTWSPSILPTLRSLGMTYSRTVAATGGFGVPDDFMVWNPTAHHRHEIMKKLEAFGSAKPLSLFYVWGHSYEFDRENNWELIETFCDAASGRDDVWYATNIEICDYISALRAVVLSADCSMAYNPTATEVWLEADGAPVAVPAGRVTRL